MEIQKLVGIAIILGVVFELWCLLVGWLCVVKTNWGFGAYMLGTLLPIFVIGLFMILK